MYQIVGHFLVGYEIWHAFEEKIEIVGSERGIDCVSVGAPRFEGLQHFADAGLDVTAAAKRIAGEASVPGVKGDHGANFVHFRAMGSYVFERTEGALFLAAE